MVPALAGSGQACPKLAVGQDGWGCGKGDQLFRKSVEMKKPALTGVAQGTGVGGVLSQRMKVCRFNSWSGHMPGFRARSPVGYAQEATNVSLSH